MQPVRAVMVSVAGFTLSDTEKRLLAEYQPIGVTLFKRNIDNATQVTALIQQIRSVIGREDVLIAIDQEGGRVCRLTPPQFGSYISQYGIGSLSGEACLEMSEWHARLIGTELKELGFNLNYAPCLDVRYRETAAVLISRCFSEDAKIVARCGQKMIEAYKEMSIIPCMKHLPGHGRVTVDPHLHLPILHQSVDSLEQDFYPFIENAKICPMGMTAHIVIPEIDATYPVTQSPKAIQSVIRNHIGFDGFLISDAIDMRALRGTVAEKTQSVLAAGCDGVCYCGGDATEMASVLQAASPLTDKAAERLAKCTCLLKQKPQSCLADLRTKYDTMAQKAIVPAEDYDAVEVLNRLKQTK